MDASPIAVAWRAWDSNPTDRSKVVALQEQINLMPNVPKGFHGRVAALLRQGKDYESAIAEVIAGG